MSVHYRPTELLISKSTLSANADTLIRHLRRRARMMAVVKADGYGHGATTEARLALRAGADSLGVALVEEAVALREDGVMGRILMLGGTTPEGIAEAVARHVSLAVYDERTIQLMQASAERLDTIAHAHIKIDTGMGRIGVKGEAQFEAMLARLKACPRVKFEGIFTHFAAAGFDQEFTRFQNMQFKQAVLKVREMGYRPIAHAAASGALLGDETLWYDMVRAGIALYGGEVRHLCPELEPAQKLVTRPIRIERIEAGEPVGYGCTWRAARDSLIATLPIGYADGYPRQLSGKAHALVKGKRAPVVGLVCMDMMMIDVTDIPDMAPDEEVVLLGAQRASRITPDELAAIAGTIPYEIMTGFTARLPRRSVL